MSLRGKIKNIIEKITGTHIYRVLPRGVDLASDIANSFPEYQVDTIFDIGANVGQSAKNYLISFPYADIYCFEPVSETFRRLKANLKNKERIKCFQIALGSSVGKGKMVLQGISEMFFMLDESTLLAASNDLKTEEVEVSTVDEICQKHKIPRINFMKIDTEGSDLNVLKGAQNILSEHRVDLVEVEVGMNIRNKRHVPFETIKAYLEPMGYYLFGIYEQESEWPTNEPHLRRTNSVFISRRMIEANKA